MSHATLESILAVRVGMFRLMFYVPGPESVMLFGGTVEHAGLGPSWWI